MPMVKCFFLGCPISLGILGIGSNPLDDLHVFPIHTSHNGLYGLGPTRVLLGMLLRKMAIYKSPKP